MKDAEAALIPWMDDAAFFTWLMLARVGDEHVEPLDFLDAALDDADSRLLMPIDDRAVLEMMLPWVNWADPATLPGAEGDPVGLLKRLDQQRRRAKPPKASPAQWARVQEFASWLLRLQGARVYAALLTAGDDGRAAQVAELVSKGADPGKAVEWLVTAALAERQARPGQLEMLKAARTPWASRLTEIAEQEIARPAEK
jgi:hypothetical protein